MDTRHSLDKRERDLGALDEVEEVLKTAPQARDYSGAHEKTDPREIALVRKLDWWIMPILWLMYWLNYLVSLFIECLFVDADHLRTEMPSPSLDSTPSRRTSTSPAPNIRPAFRSSLQAMSSSVFQRTWSLLASGPVSGWRPV
jgi:hypothetical protein